MPLFADHRLARRIERLEVAALIETGETMRRLDPDDDAAWIEINGACSLHAGADSLMTRAKGLGMDGPVAVEDVEELESFHQMHGSQLRIYLCPLADSSVLRVLAERDFTARDFVNVLALSLREIPLPPQASDVRVERVGDDVSDLWADVLGRAFSEGIAPEPHLARIMTVYSRFESGARFLAWKNGEAIGGGMVVVHEGVAMLQTSAVLPEQRTQGAHAALIQARLDYAASSGCDVAVCRTRPAAPSQRNLERMGFQVIYTEVKLTKNETG